MPGYTVVNLKELENRAVEGGSTLERRVSPAVTIELRPLGVTYIRYAPGVRASCSGSQPIASRRRPTS